MKTIRVTLTNGNRLDVEPIRTVEAPIGRIRHENGDETQIGAHGVEIAATVVDRNGDQVHRFEGVVPSGVLELLEATSFRHLHRCEVCDAVFRSARKNATVCSAKCRTRRWRERRAS